MQSEIKPWGSYEILLEELYCKVKRLTVKPGESLSLQFHYKRQEHWVCVSGAGEVTIGAEIGGLYPGDSVFIPYHVNHQLKNISDTEDLIIIETQIGEYFGEDDIVRLSDPYDRQ